MTTTVCPGVHQAVEHLDQHPDVVEVEAGGRLVENVELAAVALAARSPARGDLESLGLAARERGGGLAQPEISQADLLEVPERGAELGLVAEAGDGLVHRPLQHVVDRVARGCARPAPRGW